ncbi:MAG: hypothetical protein WBM99_11430 [Psychromonas sp.]
MFKLNKNTLLLSSTLLAAFAGQVAAEQLTSQKGADFSDPTAVYSKVGIGGGSEGVDVFGALGGYLGWQLKHQLTLEAKNDLDYYNVNYMAFNDRNNTGFLVKSTWGDQFKGESVDDESEDNSVDQASFGVIKKIPLKGTQFTLYPALHLGMMWGDDIASTTFLGAEAGVRFAVTNEFWLGATPAYTYALKGENVKEFKGTADIGYELAENVGISAHLDEDAEFWANFTFAF